MLVLATPKARGINCALLVVLGTTGTQLLVNALKTRVVRMRKNSCHGGHRVGRGRCWTSHAVRFADNTILSYLINVVPSIQCCVPVFSSGLRSAVRRRLTSGRTVVSVVRINSDIIGELTHQHCVHLYGSYAFRTSYR